MSILVTGATGNIGSRLVDALLAAGERPIVGVTAAKEAAPFADRKLETRILRFDDEATLPRALAGVERLFLLLPLVERKLDFARRVVAAARAAGVSFILRSSGARASTRSPYALMRLQADIDAVVAEGGLPFAIGRPSTFMQNTLTYYADGIRAGTLYLPNGDGRQSFVDVRDLGRAYAAILLDPARHAGHTYDLTGPEALGYADLVATISRLIGRTITYVAVPEAAARDAMLGAGTPPWNVDMLLSLSAACRDGALAEVDPAIVRIGGRPATPFARFAEDHRDAWR
jgi:uncharacterized protein YbjT (DUF2867 family)